RPTWRIVAAQQGIVVGGRVTKYGQTIMDMETSGRSLVNNSFLLACSMPSIRPRLLTEFAKPQQDPSFGVTLLKQEVAKATAASTLSMVPQ
ncbi:hypothetical protein, partial [Listeria monocytogenes]|uniref:hypothetical protein n=1 Tax=Listeria monocytogenes TaxID=1639 RepID=UPI002FDC3AFF